MRKKLASFKESLLLHLMIWSGVKLGYAVVDMYAPGEDGDLNEVKAIHFSKTEWDLKQSMSTFLEGEVGK